MAPNILLIEKIQHLQYLSYFLSQFFIKIEPGGAVGGLLDRIRAANGAIDPLLNMIGNSLDDDKLEKSSFS